MQIPIKYSKPKVIQALRYHFVTRPDIRILAIITVLFSLLSAIFLAMHKIKPQLFLLASLLWLGYFVVIFYIMPLMIYNKSKSVFKNEFLVYFSPNYLSIENEKGRTEWEWNRFSNFFESANFYHLYFNKRAFFLIPKENIEIEQRKEITKLLVKNIKVGKY